MCGSRMSPPGSCLPRSSVGLEDVWHCFDLVLWSRVVHLYTGPGQIEGWREVVKGIRKEFLISFIRRRSIKWWICQLAFWISHYLLLSHWRTTDFPSLMVQSVVLLSHSSSVTEWGGRYSENDDNPHFSQFVTQSTGLPHSTTHKQITFRTPL